jgi:hypothetical protein
MYGQGTRGDLLAELFVWMGGVWIARFAKVGEDAAPALHRQGFFVFLGKASTLTEDHDSSFREFRQTGPFIRVLKPRDVWMGVSETLCIGFSRCVFDVSFIELFFV